MKNENSKKWSNTKSKCAKWLSKNGEKTKRGRQTVKRLKKRIEDLAMKNNKNYIESITLKDM